MPIRLGGRIVGVIDLDCEATHGFDDVDQKYLETFAEILANSCDWDI